MILIFQCPNSILMTNNDNLVWVPEIIQGDLGRPAITRTLTKPIPQDRAVWDSRDNVVRET